MCVFAIGSCIIFFGVIAVGLFPLKGYVLNWMAKCLCLGRIIIFCWGTGSRDHNFYHKKDRENKKEKQPYAL